MSTASLFHRFTKTRLLLVTITLGMLPPSAFAAPPAPVVAKASPVVQLAWMPHSESLITTGKFSGLGEWMFTVGDANRLIATELYRLTQMPSFANSLAVGGKPERIVIGTNVGAVIIYDRETFSPVRTYKVGPEYSVYAVAVDREGKQVAACRTDGTVLVWNIDEETPTRHLQQTSREGERMAALAFSPDGKFLATLSRYGYLALWNLADGQRVGEPVIGSSSEQTTLHFTPKGERLLLVHRASMVVWHPQHEPKVREILPPDEVCPRYTAEEMTRPGSRPDFGHSIRFAGIMTLSPDTQRVASIMEDGQLAVWDRSTRKVLAKYPTPAVKPHDQPAGWSFMRIAFAPNGRRVAACSDAGELVVWDIE